MIREKAKGRKSLALPLYHIIIITELAYAKHQSHENKQAETELTKLYSFLCLILPFSQKQSTYTL
jgi:hypothetical protein